MGLIHATPGEMKSLRSSAERMALIAAPHMADRVPNDERVTKEGVDI